MRVKIARGLSTSDAECVGIALEAFQLGDDSLSLVLDAARARPKDAITRIDEFEEQAWHP